jgi:hypothetical protein
MPLFAGGRIQVIVLNGEMLDAVAFNTKSNRPDTTSVIQAFQRGAAPTVGRDVKEYARKTL